MELPSDIFNSPAFVIVGWFLGMSVCAVALCVTGTTVWCACMDIRDLWAATEPQSSRVSDGITLALVVLALALVTLCGVGFIVYMLLSL